MFYYSSLNIQDKPALHSNMRTNVIPLSRILVYMLKIQALCVLLFMDRNECKNG